MDVGNNITSLISQIESTPLTLSSKPEQSAPNEISSAFEETLTAALSIFNEANTNEKLADIAQIDFATGKNNDILRVVMAEQKAASSLDLVIQLTNKTIEAYREIMRIQL